MPKFSTQSLHHLNSCDIRLQWIFNKIISIVDCTIIGGHRDEVRQELLFEDGATRLHYPKSSHNATPSLAVDVAPYPIDWSDEFRFWWFGGYVLATADVLGFPLRWGGDWDGDFDFKDQTLVDLVHFELKDAT